MAQGVTREAVLARVKAKAACEQLVYRTQLLLLEGAVEEDVLRAAAQALQPQHYDDIVEERAAGGICGYPRCENEVLGQGLGPSKYVSLSRRKVYEVTFLNNFCSRDCAARSQAFAHSLHTASLFLRKGSDVVRSAAIAARPDDGCAAGTGADELTRSSVTSASVPSSAGGGPPANAPDAAHPPTRKPTMDMTVGRVVERSPNCSLPPNTLPQPSLPPAPPASSIEGYFPRLWHDIHGDKPPSETPSHPGPRKPRHVTFSYEHPALDASVEDALRLTPRSDEDGESALRAGAASEPTS